MKTKILLGLSAALLMSILGGIVSTTVMAQYQMQPTPMPQPANRIVWDYDSGWEEIGLDEQIILNHSLGGDPGDYFVYMIGSDTGNPVHQRCLGTALTPPNDRFAGCYWICDSISISVQRAPDDNLTHPNTHWNTVRVRILKNQ